MQASSVLCLLPPASLSKRLAGFPHSPTRLGQAYHLSQTPSSTPTPNTHTGILTNPSPKGTSHQPSLLRQLSTAGEGSEPQQPLLGFSHGAMQLPQLFQAHSFQRNLTGIVHNQAPVWVSKQTELWAEGADRVKKVKKHQWSRNGVAGAKIQEDQSWPRLHSPRLYH